ncbi:magnesium transporter CorA family protein [Actinoplanes regularis]|uniref:magnesium transporter CorA family protein n=1 Tax=Actinoplanes regularis TaxID=52697 RepID=UPI0024A2EAA3|nr:magnesium transporter CorA family protein [Actinoplanes regularis]GLW32551.1 magnesium transporter CorA [Actinoplanes regularis]
MTAKISCPVHSRLYVEGRVVEEDFGYDALAGHLRDHPDSVGWLDLLEPSAEDLAAVTAEYGLHPLAIEDALAARERPKLDRYPDHLFVNVYAVYFDHDGGSGSLGAHKVEISAFVTERVLITVHKNEGDVGKLVERWDADAELAAVGGVNFLLYGLFDVVVDSQYAAARQLDEAMDEVEDSMLGEGGAPRTVRMRGFALRRSLAQLRRAVAPMQDVVAEVNRPDSDLADDRLRPYYRDVEDHAERALESIEHSLVRITELLDADLNEQSNILNDITRKLAAWAAIIAVPTALTGYFGQNLPYPGFGKPWGFVLSTTLIVVMATGLYFYLKKRGWL